MDLIKKAAALVGEAAKAKKADWDVMVFDWDKAAAIIRDRKPQEAEAGLAGDYGYTRGTIFLDGQFVEDGHTYLASNWATPTLILDDHEEIECYRLQAGSGWDSDTKWPGSARKIVDNK